MNVNVHITIHLPSTSDPQAHVNKNKYDKKFQRDFKWFFYG